MAATPAPRRRSFTRGRAIRAGALLGLCVVSVAVLVIGPHVWPASTEPVTPNRSLVSAVAPTAPATARPIAATTPDNRGFGPTPTHLAMIDAKTGWVFFSVINDEAYVRVTWDGGATWSALHPTHRADFSQVMDATHAWIGHGVADGNASRSIDIARTVDGGATWTDARIQFAPPEGEPFWRSLVSMHFRDALTGNVFVAGSQWSDPGDELGAEPSLIARKCMRYSTSNGGATWTGPASAPCLASVHFEDPEFGFALGVDDDDDVSPVLYVTADGGETWTAGTAPDGVWLGYVQLVQRRADGTLRAFDGNTIITSSDGGRTWKAIGTAKGSPQGDAFATFQQVAALTDDVWLGLWSGGGFSDTIVTSQDAGLSWKPLATNGLPNGLMEMQFASPSDGWAIVTGGSCSDTSCSLSGGLYATSDGGKTWSPILSGAHTIP